MCPEVTTCHCHVHIHTHTYTYVHVHSCAFAPTSRLPAGKMKICFFPLSGVSLLPPSRPTCLAACISWTDFLCNFKLHILFLIVFEWSIISSGCLTCHAAGLFIVYCGEGLVERGALVSAPNRIRIEGVAMCWCHPSIGWKSDLRIRCRVVGQLSN